MIPSRVFFCSGVGTHKRHKPARDACSRAALGGHPALARANIVANSSVLAPGIRIIDRPEFEGAVQAGEVINVIHGIIESNTPGQILRAALAWAIHADRTRPGFVAEIFEWPGIDRDDMLFLVETQALTLVAVDCGDEAFDAESAWRPDEREYTIGGTLTTVEHVLAEIVVPRNGDWADAGVFAALLA
jgi:pyruvoyl-dependent arginine decarboxylase (PvlArgDC)